MTISNLKATQKWVELATSSPTSGSTVSFTSLTQYANYKLSYFDVDTSSAAVQFQLRINNDSTSSYAWVSFADTTIESEGVDTEILLGQGGGGSATNHSGVISIKDANQIIKEIDFWHSNNVNDRNSGTAYWNNQSTIDRLDLILFGATFTGGTIKVYGRN